VFMMGLNLLVSDNVPAKVMEAMGYLPRLRGEIGCPAK
jgi:hypothetical protein